MKGGSDKLEVVGIEIVPRRPENDGAIRALLEAAELPAADLSTSLLESFLVARRRRRRRHRETMRGAAPGAALGGTER
jgi:hypothetical protein